MISFVVSAAAEEDALCVECAENCLVSSPLDINTSIIHLAIDGNVTSCEEK